MWADLLRATHTTEAAQRMPGRSSGDSYPADLAGALGRIAEPGPRSPAVAASSQLNLVRGDLVGDGAGVAWHGGRVRVDLVGQQLQGAGDAG